MNTYFIKRYPGTRYEFLCFVTFEIEKDNKINQCKKQDILYLFKKGNMMLPSNDKKYVGPLFDNTNIQSQWFFSKKSINIEFNNTHYSIDHLRNMFKYISPVSKEVVLYCNFNTENDSSYKIFTIKDGKMINKSTDKQIEVEHLSNYFLCKLPPGKKLIFNIETEFNKPYIVDIEYDIDSQSEIKEIILFDIIDTTMLALNKQQQFLYEHTSISKSEVTNNSNHTTNTAVKFRRNHIIPIIPDYLTKQHLYDYLNITKNKIEMNFTRYKEEDNLSFIKEDVNRNIVIGFSLIGSSEYCPIYMYNSFVSLRRNIHMYDFNDKEFVVNVITSFINTINKYIKEKTNISLPEKFN